MARAGTGTVLLYCINMSFATSLKRPRCETDGNIMKIKASVVEGYGAAVVGGGSFVLERGFSPPEMWQCVLRCSSTPDG